MKNLEHTVVAIVGMGLMGGSLALALRERKLTKSILAVESNPERRRDIKTRGVADQISPDLQLLADADLIVLATPVRTIISQLPRVGEVARNGTVILDLGSTKREIVKAMQDLPATLEPLGGHPMCGKEVSGLNAANSSLYANAVFALTPLVRTSEAAIQFTKSLLIAIGARPLVLTPEKHDWAVAATSHLPFLLAATLMSTVAGVAESDDILSRLAGPGMRDTSRLAASDTEMMMDILMTNQDHIVQLLRSSSDELEEIARWIESGDWDLIRRALEDAARERRQMFQERSS